MHEATKTLSHRQTEALDSLEQAISLLLLSPMGSVRFPMKLRTLPNPQSPFPEGN
jgi:hypothetical protein